MKREVRRTGEDSVSLSWRNTTPTPPHTHTPSTRFTGQQTT